tara:strand:+ start:159 stop:1088 length:930 start_codon:yes stop_codon:yes gene_type:complete
MDTVLWVLREMSLSMRYLKFIALACSFIACTSATEDVFTDEELVGQIGNKDLGGMIALSDMGRFDTECVPGNRLGLCEQCGNDGIPEVAANDGNCPPIDCSATGQNQLVEEGDLTICYQNGSAPRLAGNCTEIGRCATLEEYCGDPEQVPLLETRTDPCVEIVGCEGNLTPTREFKAIGSPCNGRGSCEADGNGGARCSIQLPSACRFDEANSPVRFFCESGQQDGTNRTFCEYFVAPPNGGRTRCVDFCAMLGLESCQAGQSCCWNNANMNDCAKLEGITCGGEPCMSPQGCTDMICRCIIPEQAPNE